MYHTNLIACFLLYQLPCYFQLVYGCCLGQSRHKCKVKSEYISLQVVANMYNNVLYVFVASVFFVVNFL